MAEVQGNDNLRDGRTGDRRRAGAIGRGRRLLISIVRSKWIAMFAIAFAVSWSFHQVDEISQHRLEHQQRVTLCIIRAVVVQQQLEPDNRVAIGPILQVCEKHSGK